MAKPLKKIGFSEEKLLYLIQLYRENECLWNIKSADYKNMIKRKNAFQNIAEQLNITEEIVKKKIASLRGTYLMEKKKISDSQRTGTGVDDIYCPSVSWFYQMEFLNDVIIPRKTTSNLDFLKIQNEEREESDEYQHNKENITINIDSEPENDNIVEHRENNLKSVRKEHQHDTENTLINMYPEPKKKSPPTNIFKATSAKKRKINEPSSKCIDVALNKICSMTDQDIFDHFGNLIASQLRSIPMSEALQLQAEISEIVNKRLLDVYSTKSTTTSRPSSSCSTQDSQSYSTPSPVLNYQSEEMVNVENGDLISIALHSVFN